MITKLCDDGNVCPDHEIYLREVLTPSQIREQEKLYAGMTKCEQLGLCQRLDLRLSALPYSVQAAVITRHIGPHGKRGKNL